MRFLEHSRISAPIFVIGRSVARPIGSDLPTSPPSGRKGIRLVASVDITSPIWPSGEQSRGLGLRAAPQGGDAPVERISEGAGKWAIIGYYGVWAGHRRESLFPQRSAGSHIYG